MDSWNPWKVTAISMFVVLGIALIAGIVMGSLAGAPGLTKSDAPARSSAVAPPRVTSAPQPPPAPVTPPAGSAPTQSVAPMQGGVPAQSGTPMQGVAQTQVVPTQAAVDACNRYAAEQAPQNKTKEVLTDGGIGALAGAAIGAVGGAIAGGGKGAGKGAAIGGVVGAGGGALYGVNENRKNDERYRAAYASCMRGKGYAS